MNRDTPRSDRQSRRQFLKTTGATAALATGLATVGTAAARGIPTPRLHRDGKWMKDPSDNEVTLRGVNVVDPARAKETTWRRAIPRVVEHATDPERDWYSRVIRLPMQPADIIEDGKGNGARVDPGGFDESKLQTYLEKYVQPVVEKTREIGVYLILDYHRHKDQELEYTDPDLHDELMMFWEVVASRYAEESHVLFEVYNEPISPYYGFRERGASAEVANPDDENAEQTWLTWREAAQPWVDTIQANAPEAPVLIGSPRWTQWTFWSSIHEFSGDNLAYTGHVYGHPGLRPLEEYFGTPAEEVPIFMTEFGYEPDDGETQEYMAGSNEKEGQQFVDFFENHPNVSWQVWCFDHIWAPAMFSKDTGGPDEPWELRSGPLQHGKFFRDYLKETRSDRLPEGDGSTTPGTTPEGDLDPVDGTVPRDLDDDGLHEDLSGDGTLNFPDVNTFFQHTDSAAVQDHPDAYDFDGDGDVDSQDVLALFEMV